MDGSPEYTVDPRKRMGELLGLDVDGVPDEIPSTAELTYTFHQGYEKLTYRSAPENDSSEYSGVYHPNAYCEGANICVHCGCVMSYE